VSETDDALGEMLSKPLDSTAGTILVIEDNELNMKLFQDLLTGHGYKVLKAFDGLTGLQMVQHHHPDLVIMDVQLPGRLSGLEVTLAIKKDPDLRDIPVVAVTAFAMKGDDAKVREAGCDGYITKPISALSFLQSIKAYLDKRSVAQD
jgi:two-component system, cell cycle response regulator DivK